MKRGMKNQEKTLKSTTLGFTLVELLGVFAIISMIVLPLINWYNKAKQDNQITHDEIKEAVEIVQNGVEKIEEETKKNDTSGIKK